MNIDEVLNKALKNKALDENEGLFLYNQAPLPDLMFTAYALREKKKPGNEVTWLIDRNVNITNVCVARCLFCNFHCTLSDSRKYITSIDQYREKIDFLYNLGGRQLLLQGGLHPKLGLEFYANLFQTLKNIYPDLKLHALGPAEIVHIARLEKADYKTVLEVLVKSGLDSLPGAGAEILSDRVRKIVSPGKCTAKEWAEVMRVAHRLNILTSATMMFGMMETRLERIQHIIKIREVQAEKPARATGFIAFIPWPFQQKGTRLQKKYGDMKVVNMQEYIRLLAMSRILLNNIDNIQASWLTVGKETGQICLHAGANDFGSIMIEENVVSAAGVKHEMDRQNIKKAISDAGFEPKLRNQEYRVI